MTMESNHAALTHLAKQFPQTFVLEKYRQHRPLKVGIGADIKARCPDLTSRERSTALAAYTKRIMYLRGLVVGAARVDLDGNPAGEVTARDAEHAAAKLAEILAAREAGQATAVVAKAERRPNAPAVTAPARAPAAPAPSSVKVVPLMRERPVLRLPAFRTAAR
jgi:ProP effector